MRKTLIALAAATALTAVASAPASAQNVYGTNDPRAPLLAGAVVGTVVGVGLYNNWWGSGSLASSLGGASWGGAVAGGLVAGIGTIVVIDMFTNPCQGLRPLFTGQGCAPVQRVAVRRR